MYGQQVKRMASDLQVQKKENNILQERLLASEKQNDVQRRDHEKLKQELESLKLVNIQ